MIDVSTVLRRTLSASDRTAPAMRLVGRAASVRVLQRSGLFDRAWYEAQAGRAFSSGPEALGHYVFRGRFAGLSPSPVFEPAWYLPQEWRSTEQDPFALYVMRRGTDPGRSPHPLFDEAVWLAEHPEAARHPVGALGHFLATADRSTALPLPPDVAAARERQGLGPVPYGDLLDRQHQALEQWSRAERLRSAPRVSTSHDWEADAAYVRRRAAMPVPAQGDAPLVSVVMPVYNRATTVVAAIASLRSQTLPDWELVVVDDGSTDGTGDVLAELAAQDARVVVVAGEHAGISVARNVAAARARGRYLAFLDSDNTWTPSFLRTMVTALAEAGARVGYATSELRAASGSSFRALDAQVDHFAVRNHVDLNVLVLERALFAEVGGFDEGLRRTVDYDLVWRVGRRARLLHVPFVGVVYDDDAQVADRVTVRELYSWKDVVRNKHLVDWEALERTPRVVGRISALLVTRNDWYTALRAARSVLAGADAAVPGTPGADAEVVVVESAMRPTGTRVLQAAALADPRIVVETAPDDVRSGLGANLALARSTGEHVALLAVDALVGPGTLARLVDALEGRDEAGQDGRDGAGREDAVMAQALVVDVRDVVRSAGWVFPQRGTLPSPFLRDHPREDAQRLGPSYEVPAVSGSASVVRAADLVAVRGADPLFVDVMWDVDLGLRLARRTGRRLLVVPGVEVRLDGREPRYSPSQLAASHRAVLSRWAGEEPADGRALWERAGFAVAGYDPGYVKGLPFHLRVPAPVVVRPDRLRPQVQVQEATPRLRWAIKSATPPGPEGLHWGDLHFAEALADALRSLGQEAVLDGRSSLWRSTVALDDVNLSIHGKLFLPPQPGAVNLLWVISHPEMVTELDLQGYDAVFAASLPWARWASGHLGHEVRPLLQATDPQRFTPVSADPDSGHRLLFVGNSRGIYRPIVRHLVQAGEDVAVYGGGWDGLLPQGVVRGLRVDNADVPAMYRAAGVVLNDHWDDMRQLGFVSNRLFDATAAGARVVSDAIEGAEELFGGLVRTYASPSQLVELVRAGPQAFPDEEERLRIAADVARDHSFAARARVLLDAALEAYGRRP